MAAPSDGPSDEQTDEDSAASTSEQRATVAEQSPADISRFTTERRTLTSSVQLIWAFRVLVGVAILSAIASFAAARFDVDRSFVVGGAIVLGILALVWVHLRYRIWSYRVREDALYLERGVVTTVKTVAPHVRIQHVDTQRGPLERALGLSTLVVYTAGSRGADVAIPGLQTDVAADLQQRVKELAIESEGGDAL
ncbi:PH domain-containing protein [Salinibaculum salinum]|uniref:PH domain-containing protein n=1 Tax=Salinibaculum salinum TaxID=3131996 RepID=UPI0030EBB7FC